MRFVEIHKTNQIRFVNGFHVDSVRFFGFLVNHKSIYRFYLIVYNFDRLYMKLVCRQFLILQAERQTQYTIAEGGDGRWYSGTVSRRDEK